jgi:multidrug efflux pump subunit AcrA (membrane-fusion protein)
LPLIIVKAMRRKLPKNMSKTELKKHQAVLAGKRLLRNKIRRTNQRKTARLSKAEVQEAIKNAVQAEAKKWRALVKIAREREDKAKQTSTKHMRAVGSLRQQLKAKDVEKSKSEKHCEARLAARTHGLYSLEGRLEDKRQEAASLQAQLEDAQVYKTTLSDKQAKLSDLELKWAWLKANTPQRELPLLERRSTTEPKRLGYCG